MQASSDNGSGSGSGNGNGSGSGNDNGYKTTKQSLKQLEKDMERLGLRAEVEMAPKIAPGEVQAGELLLESNVFGMRLPDRQVYRYDITVEALTSRGRVMNLEKMTRDDYLVTERKKDCMEIFKSICHHEFFSQPGQVLYYDGQKTMYTLVRLPMNGDKRQVFKVDPRNLELDLSNLVKIEFYVSEVLDEFEFTLSDLSHIANRSGKIDRTVLQFIDIATSQAVVMYPERHYSFGAGTSYLKEPQKEGFGERSCPQVAEGKAVAVGVHKAACAVEGPRGRGGTSVGVIIDTAKTAFHKEQNVMNKVLEIFPRFLDSVINLSHIHQLRKQLKGLFAETRLDGRKGTVFQITNVVQQSARETVFVFEDREISVEHYYQRKYNVVLKCPEAPLLTSQRGAQINYFPMEISYIIGGQRVQQSQQTAQQLKGMREACIIPPKQRADENLRNMNALGLSDINNRWIAKAGIDMKSQLKVISRILPAPSIQYQNGTEKINPFDVAWTMKSSFTYMCPAKVDIWALYVIKHNIRIGMGEQDVRKFAQHFLKACKSRGMEIDMPQDMSFVSAEAEAVEARIKLAADNDAEFIFFIQEDTANLHDFIKSMERKYLTITQDMKMSRAMDIISKRKWQTLENIVHKTNIKLGGVNYELCPVSEETKRWLKPGRLFIGLSISHAGPPTFAEIARRKPSRPSVVGYAANIGFADSVFMGDFGFQDPRRTDMVSLVAKFVSRSIERYRVKRKICPEEVIIYRGGASEGEYAMIMNYEVPLIRKALEESQCGKTPLTLIVVNRLHRVRLIPVEVNRKAKVSEQNIKPGCVVDKQLVHPRYSEFYLNSHKALQGTAKTPRYTVLVDDNKFTMDELEGMTYSLCFCHQIVTLTTSLPTPLYVAGLYAERGRRLLHQWSGTDDSSAGDCGEVIDLDAANDFITYEGTKLAERRVNA